MLSWAFTRVLRSQVLIVGAVVAALVASSLGVTAAAQTTELPPGGTFVDDDLMPAEGYIEAIAAAGITTGCDPTKNDKFCPDQTLTRAETATLLVRAFGLPASPTDFFHDDDGTAHEASVNSLAEAGVTSGCGERRFCGAASMTRGEFASFLVRAFEIPAVDADYFSDDAWSPHEESINALAASGITSGCEAERYCPHQAVPRWQAAVLLSKALGLAPLVPPDRPFPAAPDVGEGKRIVYANSQQRIWMIDETGTIVDSYLVSGRKGVPNPGKYTVYSKSPLAWSHDGITMQHMVRFAYGRTASIGFHSIPLRANGEPMQTEAELGTFQSAGCVRQADAKAEALYEWTPVGTAVIVVP